jgi:hypothetical protein
MSTARVYSGRTTRFNTHTHSYMLTYILTYIRTHILLRAYILVYDPETGKSIRLIKH